MGNSPFKIQKKLFIKMDIVNPEYGHYDFIMIPVLSGTLDIVVDIVVSILFLLMVSYSCLTFFARRLPFGHGHSKKNGEVLNTMSTMSKSSETLTISTYAGSWHYVQTMSTLCPLCPRAM